MKNLGSFRIIVHCDKYRCNRKVIPSGDFLNDFYKNKLIIYDNFRYNTQWTQKWLYGMRRGRKKNSWKSYGNSINQAASNLEAFPEEIRC